MNDAATRGPGGFVAPWRSRAAAFAAALVLAVLLTAAGVPASAYQSAAASHATQVEARAVRAAVERQLPNLAAQQSAPRLPIVRAPRPVPRARSILSGGLPPLRAP